MSPDVHAQVLDYPAAIAGASFWLFIAIVVAVSVSAQMLKHRETQKTIRQAIERGQPLDPETVARLLAADRPPAPSRMGLAAAGLVLVCLGIGLGLLGWFGAMDKPQMLHPALGIASLVVMLGAPLLILSLFIRKGDGAERR